MRTFTIDDVVFSAQAACVLEASVEKPGNVGPRHDFEDTRYEDFVLSGIAMGRAVRKAVEFGMLFEKEGKGIGRLIRMAVEDAKRSHRGKNTNLGPAMLIIPLSAACGISIKKDSYTIKGLRDGVGAVIEGSTPEDTIDLYDAILTSDAEVGRSERFDVKDPKAKKRVMEKGMNLFDILNISKWDAIARELVTEMEVTFTLGYPSLKKEFERTGSLKDSILRCFFEILSRVPDTLIERKNDREIAVEISTEAKVILERGLLPKDVAAFDSKLRSDGNRYNPGTTADLTASSLMMALLDGILA
ncbi:MAG: triphosphoribosyl-dephospho-CoA synthase [Candidatus Hydrothermarchaeales archaeon]